ncbi:related to transcription factor spt3 [Phialocephala subalpina]|uniref:Related to transcription factor spt3 n=1 Tax=Phialocephala subalpina TaxID=576137 RepID=A0A1L7XES2_9HELO|nr:related to transcription factor spt3 [Phialocephala subalpina]
MMFVSGETAEPSTEALTLIEEIVRNQVVEMLTTASGLAARRASRFITNNDLIFQFRHDSPKVSRVQSFLAWKDLRKNAKDEDKDIDADLIATEDPGTSETTDDIASKVKKEILPLPWDISSFYNQTIPMDLSEEKDEMDRATLERLQKEDKRTKDMTKDEYITWSEYRQASFTRRKAKRFKEWAGIGVIAECKANEDVVDILGFLICEMVQRITEGALMVKDQEDIWKNQNENRDFGAEKSGKSVAQGGLFDRAAEGKMAVEPKHIMQAFANLQERPKKGRAMLNGARVQQKTSLKLI